MLLARRALALPDRLAGSARVEEVRGGLERPERYAGGIGPGTAVVHLAATTGAVPRAEHVRTNVEGTRHLLEAAEVQGAAAFLHVSTIAVKFEDTSGYPYAETKREAESLVRASALRWTIARPTLVLGEESPNWRKMRALARAPVLLVPGTGRARIQPIHVDDLCDLLLRIVREGRFEGETLELGGADVLTMGEFLRAAHRRYHRNDLHLRVPLAPGIALLRAAERLAPLPLPVTSAQFTSFRQDGVAEPSPLTAPAPDGERPVRGVEAMLDELTS